MKNKLTLSEFLEDARDESSQLPSLPSMEELKLIRKGLRKKDVPNPLSLPAEFKYEGVGVFTKKMIGSEVSFVWTVAKEETITCSYSELCMDTARELQRLQFGWMIANFARLDAIAYLAKLRPISYEDRHQDQFNRQYAREQKHFLTIENEWRHWAVVPAGHMLFE